MIKIGVRVRWQQSRRHNKPQDDDQTIIHSFIWPSSVHSLIHLCQVLGNFSHNFRAHFPRHSLYVSPIVGNGKPLGKMVRWKTAAAQLMQRIRHTIAMLHMEKTNQTAEEGYWKFPHWKILTNLYR